MLGILYPGNLWVWLLAFPVIYALWMVAQRTRTVLPQFIPKIAGHRPLLRFGLRVAAFGLLLLALMGLYVGSRPADQAVLGRQIYFVVDVSASMNVRDVKPSRLGLVKRALAEVADSMRGEQMGLIVFTNYAYTACPLTTDHTVVKTFIDLMQSGQFANTGTDFRSALGQAALALENAKGHAGVDQEADRHIARAVVLVTDGEDYGNKFSSVLGRLQTHGVSVYPVAVGTLRGGAVPALNADGEPEASGFKTDKNGNIVNAGLRTQQLKGIADDFNTPLYTLNDKNPSLKPLVNDLLNMPASRLATREDKQAHDRYCILVLMALGCLAASMLLLPYSPKKAN